MPASTKIMIGEREYPIAPMNMKTMSKHKDFLLKMMEPNFNPINNLAELQALIKDAMARTVPDISDEEIENGVDMGNIPDITKALFEVSGFKAKSGEAMPGKVSPS